MIRRALIALTSLALLSGCAAGTDAVTLKEYTPTDGNQVQSGDIKVRNFLIIDQKDGTGSVIATIVNSGEAADTLEGITIAGQPVAITASSLLLETNKPLIFGGASATATATVPLVGVRAGQIVNIALVFTRSGLVETTALVREPLLEYAP